MAILSLLCALAEGPAAGPEIISHLVQKEDLVTMLIQMLEEQMGPDVGLQEELMQTLVCFAELDVDLGPDLQSGAVYNQVQVKQNARI